MDENKTVVNITRIRELMGRHNHKQKDLARILGIAYQTMSAKMQGHRDFTVGELQKLAQAYKVPIYEFLTTVFFNK